MWYPNTGELWYPNTANQIQNDVALVVDILRRTSGLTSLTLYARHREFGQRLRKALYSQSVTLPLVTEITLDGIGAEIMQLPFLPALRIMNGDPEVTPQFNARPLPSHLLEFHGFKPPLRTERKTLPHIGTRKLSFCFVVLDRFPELSRITFGFGYEFEDVSEFPTHRAKLTRKRLLRFLGKRSRRGGFFNLYTCAWVHTT